MFALLNYSPLRPNNNASQHLLINQKHATRIAYLIWLCTGLLLANFALHTNIVHADHPPAPFTAHYTVSKGIMPIGTTKRSLTKDTNGNYVFESLTKPQGIAKLFVSGKVLERSTWSYHKKQFIPKEYEYNNSGNDKRRNVKLVFNWEKKQVTNIINGDPWTMPLEPGTLDKLLYQLAVMHDLTDNKNQLLYQVADGGKLKNYQIDVLGTETLQTELGTFETVKVTRAGKKRKVIFWCAKELHYMPIRIQRLKDNDSTFTADLIKLEGIKIPKSAAITSTNDDDDF